MKKLLCYSIVLFMVAAFISAKPKCPIGTKSCCLTAKLVTKPEICNSPSGQAEPAIHPLYIMTANFE